MVWTKEEVDRMVSLRLGGKTLQAIGDMYSLSRERVRQILTGRGISGKLKFPLVGRDLSPIPGLGIQLKKCLWDAGYARCGTCGVWKRANCFAHRTRRCRACSRSHARKYQSELRRKSGSVENSYSWKNRTPEEREKARLRMSEFQRKRFGLTEDQCV